MQNQEVLVSEPVLQRTIGMHVNASRRPARPWSRLFTPTFVVEAAHDVTPELLGDLGASAVLLDMDDTIVPANSTLLAPRFKNWVFELKSHGIPVAILSNGERARVARCAEELGVAGLALIGKPLGRAFRRGLEVLGSSEAETAMIGDQLFTDVLGANYLGLTSILVRPLSPGRLPHTRMLRYVEQLVVKDGRA